MRVFRNIAAALAVLAAACTDSCACGDAGSDAKATTQAAQSSAGRSAAPPAGDGGLVAHVVESPSWQPAPDSPLTRQLAAAKKALENAKPRDQLADPELLATPLADRLGELTADGELSTSVREGGHAKLAIAARNYKLGNKSVRVKVTDTGMLPNARGVVSRRLTLLGNSSVGNERGVFVRGYPAVVAHYPDQHLSRASVVLENRYLIQVLVRGAAGPDDARQVIEQLEFGKLAPRQGKVPEAE